jgi:hypothetical protein
MSSDVPANEGFPAWWMENQPLMANAPAEEAARSAWDAAILAASKLLDQHMGEFVQQRQYENAALIRDCKEIITFAGANRYKTWMAHQRRMKMVAVHLKKYRELSTAALLRLPSPVEGSEAAEALEVAKRERKEWEDKDRGG